MKKFVSFLLMLTCVLALTACGSEPTTLEDQYNAVLPEGTLEIALQTATVMSYQNVSMVDATNYAVLQSYNDDMLAYSANVITEGYTSMIGFELVYLTDGHVLVNGVGSFLDTVEELGNPAMHVDEITLDIGKDEIIASMPLTGELHDGSFEVIFDKNLHITSMTTNVMYSLSESMEKAATNTLIGMGTVFCMLIIIMIVIIILGAVCGGGKPKKKEEPKATSVDKAIEGIVAREEAAQDDLELIAVISAAIAASEGASSTDGFVVRSIRRIK